MERLQGRADEVWDEPGGGAPPILQVFDHHLQQITARHKEARSSPPKRAAELPARDACHGVGGMLVSINDDNEFNYIADRVLRTRTLSAFIGGFDDKEGMFGFSA